MSSWCLVLYVPAGVRSQKISVIGHLYFHALRLGGNTGLRLLPHRYNCLLDRGIQPHPNYSCLSGPSPDNFNPGLAVLQGEDISNHTFLLLLEQGQICDEGHFK